MKCPQGKVQKNGNWSDRCSSSLMSHQQVNVARGNSGKTIEKCLLTLRRSPGRLQKDTALVIFYMLHVLDKDSNFAGMKGRNGPTCHKCVKLTSFFSLRSHVTFKANSLVPLRREAVKYDQCPSGPWRPGLNHVVPALCSPCFPHVCLAVTLQPLWTKWCPGRFTMLVVSKMTLLMDRETADK